MRERMPQPVALSRIIKQLKREPSRTGSIVITVFGDAIVPRGCVYRKSNPGILVVQSAQNRATENASNCLGGA